MPTLSEITNIRGDKNVAFGSGGNPNLAQDEVVNLDISQLSNAALSQEKSNLQTLLWHREDVKNIFDRSKDMAVDVSKLNQTDAKYIMDTNNALQKKIAENLDVIADPTINPKLFAELKGEKERLAGLADKSRIDMAIGSSYRKMIESNPSWATEENKAIIDSYDKQPIETRKYTELVPPTILDYGTYATKGNEVAKSEVDRIIDKNGLIATEKQTQYGEEAYLNWAEQNYENGVDGFGRPIKDVAMKMYGTNEVDAKKRYMETLISLRKSGSNDISNLGANQFRMNQDDNAAMIRKAQIDSYTEIEKAKLSGTTKTPSDTPIHQNAILMGNLVSGKIGENKTIKVGGADKQVQVFDLIAPIRIDDVVNAGGTDIAPKISRIAYDKASNKVYYVEEKDYISKSDPTLKENFKVLDDHSLFQMIDAAPYTGGTDKKRLPQQDVTLNAMVNNNIYSNGKFNISNFAKLADGAQQNNSTDGNAQAESIEERRKRQKEKYLN
jgi:post-segregation antitoxin (ccd killing protein)